MVIKVCLAAAVLTACTPKSIICGRLVIFLIHVGENPPQPAEIGPQRLNMQVGRQCHETAPLGNH